MSGRSIQGKRERGIEMPDRSIQGNRKRGMERCQVGQSRGRGKEEWRDVR